MSNQYSFSLVTKQRKDAEKLLARAEEVLKELDPDGNSGVKFNLIEDDTTFGIGDGSLVPRQADLAFKVVNAVVSTFPEMLLHYYETCNGPLSRAAISKNGKLVEIESWEIVIITQNEEDHHRVLTYLKENTQFDVKSYPEPHSVRWQFDANTEGDLSTGSLNDLSRHFPEMLFECYKYSDCDEESGDEVQYYAQFRGHEVKWEESSLTQLALMRWHRDMNVTYADVLFNTEEVFQTALTKARADEEGEAQFIEDPATLQELCDKGNKYAAWELYWKHYYGDEEHGIFINRKRAREYYDLALERGYELYEDGSDAWDDSDDPGEEYPSTYEYVLTGNAETLDGVETLIRDLCKRFGIPENVEDGLGLFVPQRMLMKVLVGSDTEYYRGNIQYLEREAPARLVITTEADKGEPLLYALRQCFENLNVEIKE